MDRNFERGCPTAVRRSDLRLLNLSLIACFLIAAALASDATASSPSPCEALGAADAVFIGEAEPVLTRTFSQGDLGADYSLRVSPVRVEAVFRGVASSRVYLAPAGIQAFLVPGLRYLVYARQYNGPNAFMTANSYGTKLLTEAQADVEFLTMHRAHGGATIIGAVDRDESSSDRPGTAVSALPGATVVLSNNGNVVATTRTEIDGTFAFSGLTKGTYTAAMQLPPDLHLLNDPATQIPVQSDGCVPLKLRVVPNGRIRGMLVGVDGRPKRFETLSLIPAEVLPRERDRYFQQVRTDDEGQFVFEGVRPGRYLLGRLAYTRDGNPVPTVYYPGTLERLAANPVVVGRAEEAWTGEFRLVTVSAGPPTYRRP